MKTIKIIFLLLSILFVQNIFPQSDKVISAPNLLSPSNGSTNQPVTLTLDWSDVTGATSYSIQVSTNSNFSTTILNETDLTMSQYKIPDDLSDNTLYYWRANASNNQKTGPWSLVSNFTTQIVQVISATNLLSPSNGSTNQPLTPTLDWSDVKGVTSYSIQVSTNSNFSTTIVNETGLTTSQYVIPGDLSNNTLYYWRVNASNNQKTIPWSSVWNFTTQTVQVISAPNLLSPSNGSTDQQLTPTLDWSDVKGVTSYSVQVSTNSNFSTTIVNETGLTTSQYMIPGDLSNNTLYYWRVNASNNQKTIPWSSVWNFTTQTVKVISATNLLFPSNGSADQALTPKLDWSDVTGATSYSVQVSTNSNFSTIIINQTGLTTSEYMIPGGLSNNTLYYWRVNASNNQKTSLWSSVSNFITLTGVSTIGLVAYYPFNGNVIDESGNGNNGTVYGATLTTDRFDAQNNAYYFNGTSNYIKVDQRNTTLEFGTGDFTVSAWIQTDSSKGERVVSKGECFSAGWVLGHTKKIKIQLQSPPYGPIYSLSNDSINNGKWHFIILKRQRGIIYIYGDGVIDSNTISFPYSLTNTNEYLTIGRCRESEGACDNAFFTGKIDDIRLYNRALTDTEIDQLYHEGGWK